VGVATSDLAKQTAEAALREAGITADELGFIVVGTTTPDTIFPSTACTLHRVAEAGSSSDREAAAAPIPGATVAY